MDDLRLPPLLEDGEGVVDLLVLAFEEEVSFGAIWLVSEWGFGESGRGD